MASYRKVHHTARLPSWRTVSCLPMVKNPLINKVSSPVADPDPDSDLDHLRGDQSHEIILHSLNIVTGLCNDE